MAILPLILIVVVVVGGTMVGRRRGYRFAGEIVVRCRAGHLFTTTWIPGVSLKALRLGRFRFQHCPVGNHWSVVVPVSNDDLTDAERYLASQSRDRPIP